MTVATTKFAAILSGLAVALKACRMLYPEFADRLKERNLVAQLLARDEEVGRWFQISDGRVRSGAGRHARPDITLSFKDAALGAKLLMPPINWLEQINAQKDFKLGVDGP